MFIFQFFNDLQLYQKKLFGTWQFGKIGVLVNFIIKKLKSKHLISLSQLSPVTGFFEGTRENILHIVQAQDSFLKSKRQNLVNT